MCNNGKLLDVLPTRMCSYFQQQMAGAGYNFSFFLLIYQHDIMVPGYGFPFFFILNEVADYSKKKKNADFNFLKRGKNGWCGGRRLIFAKHCG